MVNIRRADKSGAEVTAVQTLREFRRRSNFAPASWSAAALRRFSIEENFIRDNA
jgi:hypothetical protein